MPMNIRTPVGNHVRFTHPTGGYPQDIRLAAEHLEVDKVYEVEETNVHSCHTDVYLVKFPGIAFNSCHFENIEDGEVTA